MIIAGRPNRVVYLGSIRTGGNGVHADVLAAAVGEVQGWRFQLSAAEPRSDQALHFRLIETVRD